MNIAGEKVLLRAIEPSDCELLRAMMNDPETEFLLGGWSFPVSTEEQRRWYAAQGGTANTLRVMIEADANTVGTAILSDIDYKNGSAQLHIKLRDAQCRGKGYGTDAVRTLVRYARSELRLHCVYAQVSAHNLPSRRLFAKCGFQQEGVLRERLYKNGQYIDVLLFSILSGEPDA